MRLDPGIRRAVVEWMDRVATGARKIADALPPPQPGKFLTLDPVDGSYAVEPERGFGAGYLAGKLWLLWDHYRDDAFRRAATDVTRWCAPLASEVEVDVGFVSQYGPAMGYELTGEAWMRDQALAGCASLVRNWNPALGILMVWPPEGPKPAVVGRMTREIHEWETYIDVASCGSVLWWARRFEPRYGALIRSHQERMIALGLIQPDGKVHHLLGFDPATGQPVKFHTAQGYRDDTHWTRAQGWGMNSSIFAYEATGEAQFLDAAIRACDYFLEHIVRGGDPVPLYDLADPRPGAPRDTCTTALACNAMVRVVQSRPELQSRYGPFVERALACLFAEHVTGDGVVVHGSWGNMWGDAAECVMPYGNIYLVETLYRLLHPGRDPWGIRPATSNEETGSDPLERAP
jgi:unsaturated chondroitin disaccharide hydrolase